MSNATFVKCKFPSCPRLIGPIRQKISDLCYQCDVNIEKWSKRGFTRRVEWKRRCSLTIERQDALPQGVSESDIAKYVHKIVTASLRKKGTGK